MEHWCYAVQPRRRWRQDGGAAVSSRKHIGLAELLPDDAMPNGLKDRFAMRWAEAVAKGGVHITSVYLHSGIGVKAKANLDLLQLIAGVLSTSNGRWIIGGDFNFEAPGDTSFNATSQIVSNYSSSMERFWDAMFNEFD